MEDIKPEYLSSILIKNNQNKSPLDISIENKSPKIIELMLKKLSYFKNECLSHLFYDRFNVLLDMNSNVFHQYLNSCFFQTIQMKNTRYLELKSCDYPLLVTHSSCLIDEIFIKKYCHTREIKALERGYNKQDNKNKTEEKNDNKAEEENNNKVEEENKIERAVRESKLYI